MTFSRYNVLRRVPLSAAALCVALLGGADASAASLLMVIQGASPDAYEAGRQSNFESAGHTVTTIQDSQSQANYDAAVAGVDVVWVPATIQDADLLHKLRTATCGVITETMGLDQEFGYASADGYTLSSTTIEQVDNSHPVTTGLASGTVAIADSNIPISLNGNTVAAGMTVLATKSGGQLSLGVLEVGATLANTHNGNSTAAGRRVRLPWGNITVALNANGVQLAAQAIAWAAADPPNVEVHLPLDESSGVVAENAAGDDDATYVGSPTLGGAGKRGMAVRLRADVAADRISVPHTAVDGAPQVSVAWWMKTTNTGQQAVLSGARAGQANAFLLFFNSHQQFQVHVNGTSLSIAVPSIADDQWRHFVYTHDHTTGVGELFINAESAGTVTHATHASGMAIDEGGLVLGEEQDSVNGGYASSQALDGMLDEVHIYQHVLSQAEICELHGLVGHWAFDEGAGTTAADSSPNANDATFNTGTPMWGEGARSGALEFDGSSDAQTTAGVEPPAVGTVAFWFRPDGPPASRERLWGVGTDFEVWQDPDGLVRFDLGADGDDGGFVTTIPLTTADRWRHLVAQYDATTDAYAIYIDGKLHKSGTSTRDIEDQSQGTLSFGVRTGHTQRYSGALDDFRLYSYWLSETEIAELHGLVGHWRLDEAAGATATDSSPIANHATHSNGAASGAAGPYPGAGAYAAEMDGGYESVTAPAHPVYDEITGAVSVAAWVCLDQDVADLSGVAALAARVNSAMNSGFALYANPASGGSLRFAILDGSSEHEAIWENAELDAGRWRHVVGTFDGATIRLYVDGKLMAQTNSTVLPAVPTGDPLVMGIFQDGRLHDVRVYNRAVQHAEIAEMYGLVAHWKLDETSGAVAYDASGMGHHAALTGTQGWTTQGQADGAFAFDYTNGQEYFTAPTNPTLDDLQEGDYTVMTWFRPDSTPPGAGAEFDAAYGLVSKSGYHLGVVYGSGGTFYNEHWLASGPTWTGAGDAAGSHPAGEYYHFAAVVNRVDGVIKAYVNGQLVETVTFTPGSAALEYGATPWRIGVSDPGTDDWDHPTHGAIDDARLYNRALSDAEVLQTYSDASRGLRIVKWLEVR